ncbi:acyltransferase [Epilithonimonas hominis]|uniref:Surface polysaccharide O-acyltransferase, integral membrane enzyme n=1 Tax=Epilithonimonas hominis TaxID=420404 RepID=A0A1H6IMU7_9FLAO|nr:acyltransferase [Epilithonimonas hominis]SEH47851.1 Surface polysaccharide O-acyltransferase, integral membrane enzyme [Epilithonimonas hominis]
MPIQYINNLRAFACILVILTHSAMPALSPDFGFYMVFFSLLGSPSSELFVTVSSSLLVPTKLEIFEFYKKRFSKLIFPVLFWSLFIICLQYAEGKISEGKAIEKLLLIPVVPVVGVYWFVYTICGLYLIIPIISPWIASAKRKEILLLIGVWSITLLMPYVNILVNKPIYNIRGDYYFIINYLGGFIGYMLMGVYLRKFSLFFKTKFKAAAVIASCLIIGTIPILYAYGFNKNALEALSDNLSLTSAFYVIAIFCFFQNFKMPSIIEKFFNIIAKYSFGIYLIHIIIVRDVVWRVLAEHRLSHPLIETPLICLVSLAFCLLIVKLISFLPKSKYVIGV